MREAEHAVEVFIRFRGNCCVWELPHYELPDYIPETWRDRITVEMDERGVHFLWTGWNNGEGHGKARVGGKIVYVYRWCYEQAHGVKLARSDIIDHLCERKPCINVEHLEKVTMAENTRRGPGFERQFKRASAYRHNVFCNGDCVNAAGCSCGYVG